MLNFGASKPRVRGGARAPGAPPLDPHLENEVCSPAETLYFKFGLHVGS